MLNFFRLLLVFLLLAQGAAAMAKQSQISQCGEPLKKVKKSGEKVITKRNLPGSVEVNRHHKHITTYKINTVNKLRKDEEWDSEDECEKDCPIKKVKPGEKVWQENHDGCQQSQASNYQHSKKTNKLKTDVAVRNCSKELRSHQNECIETVIKDDGYEVIEEWDSYSEDTHEDQLSKKKDQKL